MNQFILISQFVGALLTLLVGIILLVFIRLKTDKQVKENKPAGFWLRAICLGTDLAIIDILKSFIAYHGTLQAAGYITILLTLTYFFFSWLFFGATPAMSLARIKIYSQDGKPLKTWQIFVRLGMYAFLAIGWLTMLFDKKERKALHDIVSRTRVVYSQSENNWQTHSLNRAKFFLLGITGVLLVSLGIYGSGEKLTRYAENDQLSFFDFNQDTLSDGLTIDADADGKAEIFKYDLDNDRVIDFTTMDTDNDGTAEAIDINNDGRIDGFDFDKDNRIDIPASKGQAVIWIWRAWFGLLLVGLAILLLYTIFHEPKLLSARKNNIRKGKP